MKRLLSLILPCAVLFAPAALHATSAADLVKAQIVLNQILQITSKFSTVQVADITAPVPLANAKGKYVLPYTQTGALTEWATKSLSTQLGAAVGEKVGEEAGKQLAARVPFGGLASGLVKKKGKEMGAMAALGGEKYVRSTSSMSFNNLDDYAVYLQVKHGNTSGFKEALAAAMAIYPQLESTFDSAIRNAYQKAYQAQKR
ncbi:MAG: hypothetical protein IT582_06935 [Opitutaceae bacterium]|nr:hypothetical protein [Opitutaceae bacterium]